MTNTFRVILSAVLNPSHLKYITSKFILSFIHLSFLVLSTLVLNMHFTCSMENKIHVHITQVSHWLLFNAILYKKKNKKKRKENQLFKFTNLIQCRVVEFLI